MLCAIVEAKINGKQVLNNISTMISRLDLSFGFQMEIEERVKQVRLAACNVAQSLRLKFIVEGVSWSDIAKQ